MYMRSDEKKSTKAGDLIKPPAFDRKNCSIFIVAMQKALKLFFILHLNQIIPIVPVVPVSAVKINSGENQ